MTSNHSGSKREKGAKQRKHEESGAQFDVGVSRPIIFCQTEEQGRVPVTGTGTDKRDKDKDKNKQWHTWKLGDGMILFSLGICVFICRPPVWIFLFHHLPSPCSFLLPALVLHPVTRPEKRTCYIFDATRSREFHSKEETSLLVTLELINLDKDTLKASTIALLLLSLYRPTVTSLTWILLF